eukprot:Sspe_Gene.78180::Locus_48902_Transcript_1_1_Confidence_1.000_Length_2019::g.78180::m.78180/K20291/COG4, COD1; conserved oligomeric Golgi complex subunit 4
MLSDVAQLEENDGLLEPEAESGSDAEGVEIKMSSQTRSTAKALKQKREEVREAVLKEFNAAASCNDRERVKRYTKLFPLLGISEKGRELYSKWLRQVIGSQLAEHVEADLAKIKAGDPAGTHLTLVSQVLDHTVSCIEDEEEHVRECFGEAGVSAMITALHQECTVHSVNVLNSFLTQRKLVVGKQSPTPGSSQQLFADQDAKHMDQTLDEISHLSNNCYLYFQFLQDRYKRQEQSKAAKPSEKERVHAQEVSQFIAASALGSSKLFDKLQDILALYVPLQREYFEVAFNTMLQSMLQTKTPSATPPALSPKGGAGWLKNTMGEGLASLSEASTITNKLLGIDEEDSELIDDTHGADWVDDIFTMLRDAVRRVIRTKNASIICSIVNIINDLIRDRLLQVISSKVVFKKEGVVSRPTLIWMNAAQNCKGYCPKLASYFEALARKHFKDLPSELAKLTEQSYDIQLSANIFSDALKGWTKKVANILTRQFYDKGLVLFEQLSYVLGQ